MWRKYLQARVELCGCLRQWITGGAKNTLANELKKKGREGEVHKGLEKF